MRFGWLAAAAAMVMSAGPAQAARYFIFEVRGVADTGPLFGTANPLGLHYDSTVRFAFDTAVLPSTPSTQYPYSFASSGHNDNSYYAAETNYSIGLQTYSSSSLGYINTYPQPGGPVFGFSFLLPSVKVGETLQALSLTDGSWAYDARVDPRYFGVFHTQPGLLISVLARTSDIAPTSLTAIENLTVSVLPEPASWAMMILGFGLAGATMRRNRHGVRLSVQPRAPVQS